MWKDEMRTKDEEAPDSATLESGPRMDARPTPTRGTGATTATGATIGPSITIRGDVSGDEDLLIQGRVDGSVTLDLHAVTVGSQGRVKANITGKVITIDGEVEGDLTAQDLIVLRGSSRVQGDVRAPRVILEDGANFRGLVDMGAPKAAASADAARSPGKSAGAKEGAADSPSTTGTRPPSAERTKPGTTARPSA